MTTQELKSKCVVCHEPLTLHTWHEYRGDPMHLIIGPGSRNQMSITSQIRCETCGLVFYKEPK